MRKGIRKLKPGDNAPDFSVVDIEGHRHRLSERHTPWLLLSFYRYASCPLCNLRIYEITKKQTEWATLGLETWAIFQSPPEKMRKYLTRHATPFPLIPDPALIVYRRYAVERGWGGFMRAWAGRLPAIAQALFKHGFMPGSVEGALNRLPADFLVDATGTLAAVHYGRDIGDHMPLSQIECLIGKE